MVFPPSYPIYPKIVSGSDFGLDLMLWPVAVEDDVVIAANSVVTKSVPAGCIVAGIPAKIIGYTKNQDYDLFANPKDREGFAPYMEDLRKSKD